MAISNDYPILNGIAPSFADIALKITPDGGPILDTKDFSALSDGRSIEVGEQRGASGGRVMRRTSGSISYEGSITFYRSGYQKLYRELAKLAPSRGNQKVIRFVHFGVQIQHAPVGDVEIYDRRWRGVHLLGDGFDLSEGTDADQIEVPVSIIEIVDIIDGAEIALL
jgi:hypothetical protein